MRSLAHLSSHTQRFLYGIHSMLVSIVCWLGKKRGHQLLSKFLELPIPVLGGPLQGQNFNPVHMRTLWNSSNGQTLVENQFNRQVIGVI